MISPSKRSLLKRISMLVAGWTLITHAGCGPKKLETEVKLATNATREVAAPILGGFDRVHESTLLHRKFSDDLVAQVGESGVDCYWDTKLESVLKLQKLGQLEKVRWGAPSNWPELFKAKDGSWIGIAGEALVILVNTERIPVDQPRPTSLLDVASDRWGKETKVERDSPLRSDLIARILKTHAGSIRLSEEHQPERFNASGKLDYGIWKEALLAMHPLKNSEESTETVSETFQGNTAVDVGKGELAWGVVTSTQAKAVLESGGPVEIVFPDQFSGGFGTLLVPQAIAVSKSAKNPKAAQALSTYLSSASVEGRLVMVNQGLIALHPDSELDSALVGQQSVRWAAIDFERIYAD